MPPTGGITKSINTLADEVWIFGPTGCTYYINDDTPLLKLQLAGKDNNAAMRIGGKGYRLDKVGILVDNVEDRDFLRELIEAIYEELPAPKKRK